MALVLGVIAASIRIRVEVIGLGVDIDEDGCGTRIAHDIGRGDKGERGDDDLVPGANAEQHQRQMQCRGAARGGHGLLDAHIVGDQTFECGHLRPLDDPPRPQNLDDSVFFCPRQTWVV